MKNNRNIASVLGIIAFCVLFHLNAPAQNKWEWLIEPQYYKIGNVASDVGALYQKNSSDDNADIQDGIVVAWMARNKPGYIDISTGKWHKLPYVSNARYYYNAGNGLFRVARGVKIRANTWLIVSGLMDKTGKWLFDPKKYEHVSIFSEGVFYVREQNNGKRGLIDRNGKWILENVEVKSKLHEGLAAVQKGDNIGFVDASGKWVIEPEFHWAQFQHIGFNFSGGLRAVMIFENNKFLYGVIDKSGNWVIPPKFTTGVYFSEGLAVMKQGDETGFIDQSENWVISPRFTAATSFTDGLAMAKQGNEWGYIDKSGNWVIPPRFKYARDFSENVAIAGNDNYLSYIDKSGKEIYGVNVAQTLSHDAVTVRPFHYGVGKITFPVAEGTGTTLIYGVQKATYSGVSYETLCIDKNGNTIISRETFDRDRHPDGSVVVLQQGIAKAKKNGKWGLIRIF